MENLTTKECVKLGAIYERLKVNPDYKELYKFIVGKIQDLNNALINSRPRTLEEIADDSFLRGQLIGVAEPEAHMISVIKIMKEEELRLVKEKQDAGHSK